MDELKGDVYLSPKGAREYMEEDGIAESANFQIKYQNFGSIPYPQQRIQSFQSYLSILDLICNIGLNSAEGYINNGF